MPKVKKRSQRFAKQSVKKKKKEVKTGRTQANGTIWILKLIIQKLREYAESLEAVTKASVEIRVM